MEAWAALSRVDLTLHVAMLWLRLHAGASGSRVDTGRQPAALVRQPCLRACASRPGQGKGDVPGKAFKQHIAVLTSPILFSHLSVPTLP